MLKWQYYRQLVPLREQGSNQFNFFRVQSNQELIDGTVMYNKELVDGTVKESVFNGLQRI